MKVGQEVATYRRDASKNVEVHAVGMAPTERLKFGRQMTAAVVKKSTTSLSLFMETYGLEVEEELSTMATQYWTDGVWTGNGVTSKKQLG